MHIHQSSREMHRSLYFLLVYYLLLDVSFSLILFFFNFNLALLCPSSFFVSQIQKKNLHSNFFSKYLIFYFSGFVSFYKTDFFKLKHLFFKIIFVFELKKKIRFFLNKKINFSEKKIFYMRNNFLN